MSGVEQGSDAVEVEAVEPERGAADTALFPEISNEPTRIIAFSWVEVLKPIDVGVI